MKRRHRDLFPDCIGPCCVPLRWWCDDCGHPFRTETDLIAHRSCAVPEPAPKRKVEPVATCGKCGAGFDSRAALARHRLELDHYEDAA